jgi:uncharacterized protein YdhG (YjbR/CyaY superfamily)
MWQCPKCGREFKNTNQDHYCGQINTIDEYIADQPDEVQPILQGIRETIRASAPNATEKISWRMPTFWQGENLIHFAAFKKHIGIYPGDLTLVPFEERLVGYRRTKGAIQFPISEPIDHALIADLTAWRLSCVESKGKTNAEMDTSKMTRQVYDIPDFVAAALDESGLWERYRARPPYQRNDYIGWISRGKREETQQKRLAQMLAELRSGDAYMGMKYHAK